MEKNGPEASYNVLTPPSKVKFQSVNLGEINAKMQLNQKKRSEGERTLKIKFDSSFEFMKKAEVKKSKDKQYHLYIFEEIPKLIEKPNGKADFEYTQRPLVECQDLSSWKEQNAKHVFPHVQVLSTLFEN